MVVNKSTGKWKKYLAISLCLLVMGSIVYALFQLQQFSQDKKIKEVAFEASQKQLEERLTETLKNTEDTTKRFKKETKKEGQEQPTEEKKQVETVYGPYEEKAKEKMLTLSLEEKIGQLFLARCPDVGAIEQIESLKPGGYILFGRDFKDKTKEEVIQTIKGYQEASTLPMLMAVDEEGGSVVRISSNPLLAEQPFKSPQELDRLGGLKAVEEDTLTKGKLLKELGIQLNLAPVADVTTEPTAYMYGRTFGKQALETAEYVITVIKAVQKLRLASTLKHFPGYGENGDTHTAIVRDTRDIRSFREVDLIPFKMGIEEGVESILVSHNIVEAMDKDYPASLSPKVHKLLRDELGFTGVIMTDDLAMEAIQLYTKERHPAVLALEAGNDLLIISDLQGGYEAIREAVQRGEIDIQIINEAATRVLAWKYKIGIIN